MEFILPDDLVAQLKSATEAENRDPADLLRDLLARYRTTQSPRTAQQIRQSVYERARAYWLAHDRPDRAALSDHELDKIFKFIDQDGVPHLEEDKTTRATDPLQQLVGTLDTDAEDLSTSVRDTLGHLYRERYERPD